MEQYVFLVDDHWSGHIPTYHSILIDAFSSLDKKIISISPNPKEAKKLSNNKAARYLTYRADDRNPEPSKLLRAKEKLIEVQSNIQSAINVCEKNPDLIFFTSLDSLFISARFTCKDLKEFMPFYWSGIYVTPKYLRYKALNFLYKTLIRKDRILACDLCKKIFVLDTGVIPSLKNIYPKKEIVGFPDFINTDVVEQSEILDEIKKRSSGKKIIGLFGEISLRKGISLFFETAKLSAQKNLPYFFVCIGRLNLDNTSKEERQILTNLFDQTPENMFTHLKRVENEAEFNTIISSVDIVFAAYKKFFNSSNMLTKSAYFKKPIIVSKGYYMAEVAINYKFGKVLQKDRVENVLTVIDEIFKDDQSLYRFDDFYEHNKKDHIASLLDF